MENKKGHHLWSAEKTPDGKMVVRRSRLERDDWDESELEYARNVAASVWGVFGAHMADVGLFNTTLDKANVDYLNKAASKLLGDNLKPSKPATWESLKGAFGKDAVEEAKALIAKGIKARVISKDMDIPLVMAYDLMDGYSDIDNNQLKKVLASVKSGKVNSKIASEIKTIYDEYAETNSHKIAIDEVAKKYFINYYGNFGEELVKEIKKRVRADLARRWLTKQGLDQAAIDYWQDYYGEYGRLLTKGDVTKERKAK